MRIIFRGWRRHVITHDHEVIRVKRTNNNMLRSVKGELLAWDGPLLALGKLNDLRLTGSFLAEFEFEEQELENWLTAFAKARPADALRLSETVERVIAASEERKK